MKIFITSLFTVVLTMQLFCQISGGDLRTDATDTIYIRSLIHVEGSEFIGLKQDDLAEAAAKELTGLNSVLIPLSSTDGNPEEFLSVEVHIVKNYFTVIVEYNRKALYRGRGTNYFEIPAPTWRTMIGGGHGSENKYILDVVSDCFAKFTKDFKEQNNL